MSSWLNFIFKTIGLIICFLFYSRMRGFSMLWVIFERNLKEVFLLAVWVSDIREIILCNEKWKICLCTHKSNFIGWYEYFVQVQNLVTMAPFYLPVNTLLLCDLVQRLHKSTIVHQNLLAISTWRYIRICCFIFCFFVHWIQK